MARNIGFGGDEKRPAQSARVDARAERKQQRRRWFAPLVIIMICLAWSLIALGGIDAALDAFERVSLGVKPISDLFAPVGLPLLAAIIGLVVTSGAFRGGARRNESWRDTPDIEPPQETHSPQTSAPTPTSQEAQKLPKPLGARIFQAAFLAVWLVLWTGAILFASSQAIRGDGGPALFLLVWVAFAVVGWFFAARRLLQILFSRS